mgnify:CR=1 FL=1
MVEETRRNLADCPFDKRKEALDIWAEAKAVAKTGPGRQCWRQRRDRERWLPRARSECEDRPQQRRELGLHGMVESGEAFDWGRRGLRRRKTSAAKRERARERAPSRMKRASLPEVHVEIARYRKAQEASNAIHRASASPQRAGPRGQGRQPPRQEARSRRRGDGLRQNLGGPRRPPALAGALRDHPSVRRWRCNGRRSIASTSVRSRPIAPDTQPRIDPQRATRRRSSHAAARRRRAR